MQKNIKFLLFLMMLSSFLFVIPKLSLAQNKADNCEIVSLKLDILRDSFAKKNPSQVIILIARLGKNEKISSLNQRRLYTVKKYLTIMGVQENQIITATGEVADENGKVEIYCEGQLMEEILAGKNTDIPVGSCDNDKEDREKYQLPKARLKQKK